MGRKGPLLTLLGGVALASVLVALDVRATHPHTAALSARPSPSAAPAPPSAAPTKVISSAQPVASRATYAGYTTGGAATIAIAVHDGVAIAYLCDGSRVEAWLRGSATGGQLSLSGTHGSTLTGSYGQGVATGRVSVGAKHWTFRARAVYPPSGLYRATAEVRNAKVEGGWIVLSGRQVGVETVDGVAQPASTLDTTTLAADVNGATVTAVPVDGTTGSGF